MRANVGTIDRVLRLILGLIALWAVFLGPLATADWSALRAAILIVGIILIATAAIKFCPAYRLVGMNTCSAD